MKLCYITLTINITPQMIELKTERATKSQTKPPKLDDLSKEHIGAHNGQLLVTHKLLQISESSYTSKMFQPIHE